MKFFYKTKGVISIFLIMIMLPLFTSAVLLVDGARYHSAKTLIQEAGDLAAYSVIANYNLDLKDEFGLFAIDDKNVTATFEKYFKDSLGCSEAQSKEYSEKVQGMLSDLIYGNEYSNANFYNLYNFDVSVADAKGIYPLSKPSVLQNQIVEYAKYRGVETILERFEIIKKFGELEGELDSNSKTMDAIEELADIDQNSSKAVTESIENMRKAIEIYNTNLAQLVSFASMYEQYYADEMTYMAVNDRENISFYTNSRKDYAQKIYKMIGAYEGSLRTQHSNIGSWCEIIEIKAKDAIADYNSLKTKYSNQKEIIEDIDSELKVLNKIISNDPNDSNYSVVLYKKSFLPLTDLCAHFDDFKKTLDQMENNANNAITLYNKQYKQTKTELQNQGEMSAEEIEAYLYENVVYDMYVKNGQWAGTKDKLYLYESIDNNIKNLAKSAVKEFKFHDTVLNRYNNYMRADILLNYYDTYADQNKTVKNKETGETVSKENETDRSDEAVSKTNSSGKGKNDTAVELESKSNQTIPDNKYSGLPSQVAKKSPGEEKTITQLDKNNPSAMLKSSNSAGSEFMQFLESGRNDVLTFCYILDMFKTKNSATDYSDKTRNRWYSTNWRFINDKGEVDLRDRRKDASLKTFFNTSEVEYVFGGNKSESINNGIVYSWIYGTRLANNIVAVYTNPTAKAECLALAAVASAATSGIVPVSVFKWVFIAAWAAGETALEMAYLISDGYRVPLLKTKNNLFIDSFTDVLNGVGEDSRENLMTLKSGTGINVCYEDYLLLLMCFVDRETRLLRVADLIELNMQERGHGDFKMSEANTYIEANTSVSAKFLFQPVKQFSDSYLGKGFKINNKIYQGY